MIAPSASRRSPTLALARALSRSRCLPETARWGAQGRLATNVGNETYKQRMSNMALGGRCVSRQLSLVGDYRERTLRVVDPP